MKNLMIVLWALSFGMINAQEIKAEYKKEVKIPMQMSYLLDLPKDAKDNLPLIVYLHGSGERGNDLEAVKRNGVLPYKHLMKEPVAILAPQCPLGRWWDTQAVYHLIKDIQQKYKINPDRIYLTGLSMGGWGVWKLANEHPELFAAIAPVCGATDRWMKINIHQYKGLPIRIYHGGNDDLVSPMYSIEMFQALKREHIDAKLILFPEDNHNSWDSTYSNPEFYEWLLSQKKKNNL